MDLGLYTHLPFKPAPGLPPIGTRSLNWGKNGYGRLRWNVVYINPLHLSRQLLRQSLEFVHINCMTLPLGTFNILLPANHPMRSSLEVSLTPSYYCSSSTSLHSHHQAHHQRHSSFEIRGRSPNNRHSQAGSHRLNTYRHRKVHIPRMALLLIVLLEFLKTLCAVLYRLKVMDLE